jgi:hypothetical protein
MMKQGNGWKRLGFVLRKIPVNIVRLTMRTGDLPLSLMHLRIRLIDTTRMRNGIDSPLIFNHKDLSKR